GQGGRGAVVARARPRLARLMTKNSDTRRAIYRLPQWQIDMIETARACGASAKFAGSGGAILGTYDGEDMFAAVRARLGAIGSRPIKPPGAPRLPGARPPPPPPPLAPPDDATNPPRS